MQHSTADLEVAKKSEMVPGHRNYFGIPIASKPAYPTEKFCINPMSMTFDGYWL